MRDKVATSLPIAKHKQDDQLIKLKEEEVDELVKVEKQD